MAGSDKHELGFFLLRYVPDAVKDEFVNVGIVLVGGGVDAGYADVRFTRDWRRVLCMDPGADLEWLQALEKDIRMRLQDAAGREEILFRLQDLCSNVIQVSATKGCLGAEPAQDGQDPHGLRPPRPVVEGERDRLRHLRRACRPERFITFACRRLTPRATVRRSAAGST